MIDGTKLIAAVVAVLAAASPASAGMNFCSEPSEPYCLSSLSMNLTEISFNTCKAQVMTYLSEIDEYKSCLVLDTKTKISEKTDEANHVIQKINCIASGQSACY